MAETLALVPVFSGTISNTTVQLCDARTLHNFMQVRRDFTTWIKGRIRKFGFAVNEDYLLTKSGEQLPSGMKYVHDYHLTLDMAKELSMVENNEQGRAARRYFIECERQALAAAQAQPVQTRLHYERIGPAGKQAIREAVARRAGKNRAAYSFMYETLHRRFDVNSYHELPEDTLQEALALVKSVSAAEWELVDEAPALPHQPTVNEIVAEWVEKIEQPNGYPAVLFMPLVNAVLRKQGFNLALSAVPAPGLLPEAQAKEITERLDRLGKLFNPLSQPFNDVMGVLRALRGLHPVAPMPEPGYRQLLPRLA